MPVGTLIPSLATKEPEGWLLCDGREVSRTEYKTLFDTIGTSCGIGDGLTTFNLPDFRDRTIWGAGGSKGLGEEIAPSLPNIKGKIRGAYYGYGQWNFDDGAFYSDGREGSATRGGGGGDPSNINVCFSASRSNSIYSDDCNTVQPPAIAVNIFIKT